MKATKKHGRNIADLVFFLSTTTVCTVHLSDRAASPGDVRTLEKIKKIRKGFSSPQKAIRFSLQNGEVFTGEARPIQLKNGWGFRTADGRVVLPSCELTWLEYLHDYQPPS